MGSHSGFASWFLPVYLGFFVLVAVVAVVLLSVVLRRPLERFPGSWPGSRLRWAAVPAIALALLGLQLALIGSAFLPDKALFATAKARLSPGAPSVGLATVAFAIATLAEGILYLLRVAFPAERRKVGHHDADGAEADEADAGAR
jgi:hypothetical protein